MVFAGKAKILNLISASLSKGRSCNRVSLCIALGAVLGVFPVLGTTTFLCATAAFVFRLNLPLIQVVNYAVYPLQLILLAFFYGAGSWLFIGQSFLFRRHEMIEMLQNDLWGSIIALWDLTLYATLLWMLIGPVLALVLYGLIKPVVRKLLPGQHPPIPDLKRLN